ncbi:ABC transporter permease [Amycolatopsis cihanbeyliensis]|uniref:Oligopeptide transport system permease protein n=1 Tax=Amycolatopsis cihanbeyliensis TaxID=1128664 RepID=A0A542DLV1_AMYCI|nr:ABC transporter permease [Amycolatopsis cihanbeyliensis]TQJ04073.1 oligopeptide transport system permease protein [Amycolatopsis cihanbeyliensis]
MLRYTLRRLANAAVILFIIITVTWFLLKFLPGTPFNDPKLTAQAKAALEEKYGLNDPLVVQYLRYLGNVLQGDLGTSFQLNQQPITEIIMNRLPVSAFVGLQAVLVGTVLGILLGGFSAARQNSIGDRVSTLVSVLGISVPTFVFAPLLQYYFAYQWDLLPIAFFESWEHSVLPSAALGILVLATVAAYTRTEMLEVLGQDYVLLAKAKGLSGVLVVAKHVLRNSLLPLITVIVPLAAALLTGTLVVEKVFAIPGIGEQFIASILVNDYPMILGVTIMFSIFFVLAYLVQDLLYGLVDPRIRLARGKE